MARHSIIDKLDRALRDDVTTEGQVLYILVEIRKLMEADKIRDKYNTLGFYCDWAVHPYLERNAVAHAVIKKFDDVVEPKASISEAVQELMSFRHFQKELQLFLAQYGLPTEITDKFLHWSNFVNLYAHIISECPLICKNSQTPLKNIDQVKFTRTDSEGNRAIPAQIIPFVIRCEASRDGTLVDTVIMEMNITHLD